MKTLEIFSSKVCPFAHRTRLAAMEKGVPFELIEIDLHNKPDWYRDINPQLSVPALRHGDFVLRESLIINEYIDELKHSPALMPHKAQERAIARLWMDFAATRLVPVFYRLLKAQDGATGLKAREELLGALGTIEEELARDSKGPYWFGEKISLTDIAFYPWFERWAVLEHYRGFALPQELSAIGDWINAMAERESVKQGRQPAEFYIAEYEPYASGKKG